MEVVVVVPGFLKMEQRREEESFPKSVFTLISVFQLTKREEQ